MMLGTRQRMDTPNSEQPSLRMGANLLERADLNRTYFEKGTTTWIGEEYSG
jgi:hypothetical protein